jgi:hypothetical protein
MIDNQLISDNFLLSPMGKPETSGYKEFDDEYRGWRIWLDCPNGGILAVDILHYERGLWLGCSTCEKFDYDDDEGIVNYAKEIIDKIESFLDGLSGQLSLLEVV